MRNVSLYIAKRYNTYTLLISLVIILISVLSISAFTYIGHWSIDLFEALIFSKQLLTNAQKLLIYSLSFAYVSVQTLVIYWLFQRLFRTIQKKLRTFSQFLVAIFLGSISFFLLYFIPEKPIFLHFIILLLISSAMLSFIIGLISFLLSKSKITGVNIITSIAVFAITIGTAALFIILSVFSGLEKMNLQFLSNVNPDLKISPAQGKTLPDLDQILEKLAKNQDIAAYAKVIEEKVSIEFDDKQDIAYIKGVDENYNQVIKLDTTIVHGHYFDFKSPYEILASDGVARRLQLYIDNQHPSRLLMPKPGTGLITSEEEAFNTAIANPIGVFIINDQYDKYVFSPIELTQQLLQMPKNSAYAIEIKLNKGVSATTFKNQLQQTLGEKIVVKTRQDIDATFHKVMNIENLIIYLIFTLVIIIASFNLAGAIIIIIIDKKKQIKSMWSFGMNLSQIKSIFLQTGFLITIFSVLFGLFLGSGIGFLQNNFQLVMANPFVAFPFEFTLVNYLTVTLTVLTIGGAVSWLVSRKLPI
ncbi:MAG TPA: ABC transporter permease [Moheibacter sp.]|nr:ABC transporter permease [Moheibacter sp.]